MHELSLVDALCRQVIAAAAPVPTHDIRLIRVAAGPLSGVEPLLVQQAFETARCSWGLETCELHIDERPLLAVCRQCQAEFEVCNFVFRCAACGSGLVRVTQGDEFRLVSIDIAS
jgi:hydrogenase nickel incorporation protein HypA/HybF